MVKVFCFFMKADQNDPHMDLLKRRKANKIQLELYSASHKTEPKIKVQVRPNPAILKFNNVSELYILHM